MSDLLGTTVESLVAALRSRRAPVPYEMGAFIALQVCEALQSGPAAVRPADVRIAEDGAISVFAPPHSATDAACAKSIVALLAQLLVAAGPGVPSPLLALVEREPKDLRRLRDELEATLVPLNRGASRRVLSRLVREASAAPRTGAQPSAPAGALLDDALDDLLGEPPRTEPDNSVPGTDDDLDALLASRTSAVPSRPGSGPHAFDGAGVPKEVFDRRTPPSGVSAFGPDPFADPPTKPRDAPRAYVPASTPPPSSAGTPAMALSSRTGTAPGGTGAPARLPTHPGTSASGAGAFGLSAPFAAGGAPSFEDEEPTGEHSSRRPPPRPDSTEDVDLQSPSTMLADTTLPKPAKLPSFEDARVTPAAPTPRPAPFEPTPRPATGNIALDGFDETGVKKGRPLLWLFLLVVVVGGFTAGAFVLRPDLLARLRGGSDGIDEAVARRAAEHDRQQAELIRQHAARFGDLVVRSTPDRAQVLMYVGRGPATVSDLPGGVAHEFVAIAEGMAPSRAVVPPDAAWESTPEGRRFELAIQTSDHPVAEADLDLGATRLPHDPGTPTEDLGSVRVVTAPVGAKVYQLVGFTPDVHVSDVRTDEAIELLVWLDGYRLQRRVVGPSDWRVEDGKKVAEIDVTLEERPATRHH